MKNKLRLTIQILISIFILQSTSFVFAQHLTGGYYKGEYREEAIQKLYEDLGLSQEQRNHPLRLR